MLTEQSDSRIRSLNGRFQPRLLMSQPPLVEFGPEAIRQPERFVLLGHVTPRTRRAGAAAGAGVLAFPWSTGMAFTYPAAILAQRAFHGLPVWLADVCRPAVVVRRAAS
jgi:hypothetical protein